MTTETAPPTWAVVTGASRGIGHAIALELSRRGLAVALVGRPSQKLDATAAACGAANGRAQVFTCDLADAEAVLAVGAHLAQLLCPAYLFNVAGVIERERVADLTLGALQRQFQVNLYAPMLLTQRLVMALRSHRRGAVINVGSISGTLGSATQSAYNASKWGLIGFTKSLALELSDSGAFTVALLPGAVDTDMLVGSGYPPRMTAEEVARAAVYHALDGSVAHNGGVIEMFGT